MSGQGVFRQSWAWLKGAVTSKEARDRYVKIERAIELVKIDGHQAEVDNKAAQTVGSLLDALKDVPEACIRVGSTLLIKNEGPRGPQVLCRTLSQLEVRTLERFPEIQRVPARTLELLASAMEFGDSEDPVVLPPSEPPSLDA